MVSSGYRLGVSITSADVRCSEVPEAPAGVVRRPARLSEVLPPAERSDVELAEDLARITEIEAALAASRAKLVVELASRRPAREQVDGVVDEFFCDELAVVLNCSRTSATVLLEQARTLIERLPATWAALADGHLDWPRARALAEELGHPADDTNPAIIAAVEAAVLPRAASLSIRALRDTARRELLARDAAAAELRRRQAERAANVAVRPTGNGRADLISGHAAPAAAAMFAAIDAYAWLAKKAGDDRPIGVIRAEVHEALVLRPWDTSRQPVTAHLQVIAPLAALHGTVTATGGPAPTGSVDGMPITAAHLKQLLTELDTLGVCAPAGGSLSLSLVDDAGRLRGTATRRELQQLTRRGCRTHQDPADHATTRRRRRKRRGRRGAANGPIGSLAPEVAGAEGASAECGCPALAMPPPVERYRPTPAQRRFVTGRDRTCRHPGCRNKAGWADLDHVIPHAGGGATDCRNLCCLCRRHHRLKTHARGWRFVMADDGTLHVSTPSGVTRTTRPPGMVEHLASPPGPRAAAEDPPPF